MRDRRVSAPGALGGPFGGLEEALGGALPEAQLLVLHLLRARRVGRTRLQLQHPHASQFHTPFTHLQSILMEGINAAYRKHACTKYPAHAGLNQVLHASQSLQQACMQLLS